MKTDTHLHTMTEPFCGHAASDVPKLMEALGECGLDGGWISSITSTLSRDLEVQKRQNDALAALAGEYRGRLWGFGTVTPDAMEAAGREVERCARDLGLIGIKLHPWLQSFSVTAHPGMDCIMEAAAAEGLPVLFHDGSPPYTTPCQIALVAERHPRAQVVLGHCGLADLWRDAADAARRCGNIWLQPTGAPPVAIRAAFDAVGRERLLFGSDGGFGLSGLIRYCVEKYRHVLGEEVYGHVLTANPGALLETARRSAG